MDTREWLITNGIGGYASGTVIGANTRTYHGYLVASMNPPTDRKVFLAKVEERICKGEEYIDLSANYYPDSIHPKGYKYLSDFKAKPFPTWTYKGNNWQLSKRVKLLENTNTTVIEYKNTGKEKLSFEVHPLWSCTIHHDCFLENLNYNFWTEVQENSFTMYPYYQSLPIYAKWEEAKFIKTEDWYKNIQLIEEKNRGLSYHCDYYRTGYYQIDLEPNEVWQIVVSTDKQNIDSYDLTKESNDFSSKDNSFFEDIKSVAKQFIVRRNSTQSESIIAGYHWFTDWGRDTMISMQGLTIAMGDKETSESILKTFLSSVKNGLLPNRFPDNSQDKVQYNNLDASLWLFVTLYEYYQQFKDKKFISENLEVLKGIISSYLKGTIYNIYVTEEGFLYGGEEGVQLTWMDAIVNGKVITPRMGCPVEINALWYNTLAIYEFFSKELNKSPEKEFQKVKEKLEKNFSFYFINEEGTLYDVIVPSQSKDNSFRPNQLYAISLPFTLIEKATQEKIFEQVKNQLFTFYGLRSLSPNDKDYIGHYGGNPQQRDGAYHQGTVWPFLLEPYFTSYFKLYGSDTKHKEEVVKELQPLIEHFYNDAGMHCISEVFDGDNPQHGKGCIQQAWSLGAIVKLYLKYELNKIK